MYPYSYVRCAIIYSTRPGFSIIIYYMNLFIQQQLAILLIIDKMNYRDIDWAQISIHNNSHNHIIWLYMILFHSLALVFFYPSEFGLSTKLTPRPYCFCFVSFSHFFLFLFLYRFCERKFSEMEWSILMRLSDLIDVDLNLTGLFYCGDVNFVFELLTFIEFYKGRPVHELPLNDKRSWV